MSTVNLIRDFCPVLENKLTLTESAHPSAQQRQRCARPRAQQRPNVSRPHQILESPNLPTLLRPGTDALQPLCNILKPLRIFAPIIATILLLFITSSRAADLHAGFIFDEFNL